MINTNSFQPFRIIKIKGFTMCMWGSISGNFTCMIPKGSILQMGDNVGACMLSFEE